MWNWDGHMDNGWGLAMMLGMLGFWLLLTVAIGLAVVWTVRSARPYPPAPPPTSAAAIPAQGGAMADAEHILAERLARGDIEPEEYRTRLAALSSPSES